MCASAAPSPTVDNAALPEPVRVPAGHKPLLSATGVGELTYECREKKDAAGVFEWAFVGPVAKLYAADKKEIGKYYAGPTWESVDGSKVTGKQVAVVGALPRQPPPAPAIPRAYRQQVVYEAEYVFYGS